MSTPYACKSCGLAVIILDDGGRIWACDHRGTIVANCDAVVTADGGVTVQRAISALDRGVLKADE